MKTNANSRYTVAVLIDGDNASFERMEDIMGFVSRYGDAVVRRIYGDWTRKALSAWKESAREHGFRLVQASSHVPGKNTTDIALVIDAMDILRDGQADCFCLVASDGDYSLLAQRIREAGVKVLGYGEGKTPVSLVRSCSVFLYADRKESKAEENTPEFFIRRDMEYFDKAFEQAADGKEEVSLLLIGNVKGKIPQPSSTEYLPIPKMNVITEEVPYSTIREKDSGPSCSLTEALQKQDLFINSMLAQIGCDVLWRMLREGRTFYRGAYLNLDTLRVNPIPV